jgi:Fe-S cluster assembly scaffold protein SufB
MAEAVPRVYVFDKRGRGATIGCLNNKQVVTMISCGLDESEAVEMIVRG